MERAIKRILMGSTLCAGVVIALYGITLVAYNAIDKQMIKNETAAMDHQATIAERERVAANSIGNYLRYNRYNDTPIQLKNEN